jgi:hypothetical protein
MMEANRFEDLLRALSADPSRRGVARTLLGLTLAGPLASLLGWPETEAKKKKRKKKRTKKCRGGTRKCGKTCIPSSNCCTSDDCDAGETCQNGSCTSSCTPNCSGKECGDNGCGGSCGDCSGSNETCQGGQCVCAPGFKECNGACIPNDQCCGACPGDKLCDGGECVCPADAPNECPGNVCLFGGQCCETAECPASQTCINGVCVCPIGDITCGAQCCDAAENEICVAENFTCQGGGCPPTNFCNATEIFFCALDPDNFCACATTTGMVAQNACVDFNATQAPEDCTPCGTSADCGAGEACIPGGDFCGCGNNFCVPLCGEAGGLSVRSTARGTGSRLSDVSKAKSSGKARRQPRRRR